MANPVYLVGAERTGTSLGSGPLRKEERTSVLEGRLSELVSTAMLVQSSAYPTNIAVTGARKEVSRVRVNQREIVLYTADRSLRSWRAKRLLARRGYHFEVVRIINDGLRARLKRLRSNDYRQTVPYLYVDNRPVGGWGDIKVLDGSGTLELLVRGEV